MSRLAARVKSLLGQSGSVDAEPRQQEKERERQQRQVEKTTLDADRALFYPVIDYEAHPFYRDFARPSESLAREVFERYVPHFQASLQAELAGARSVDAGSTPVSDTVLDSVSVLRRRGIVPLRLSGSDRQGVVERTEDAVRIVDQRRAELPAGHRGVKSVSEVVAHTNREDDVYEFFSDLLTRYSVFETCRRYYGYRFKLKRVKLQVNDGSDRGIDGACRFPDGTRSRMSYLHLDTSVGFMKLILYRSEGVTASRGAFRFYPGSHAVLTPLERCIRKANDRAGFELVNDNARASFMALPPKFRFKANFGNDLLDGDAMDRLAVREHVCESSEGDLLLFDNNGLHRGAMFEDPTGRREILQLLLVPDLELGTTDTD